MANQLHEADKLLNLICDKLNTDQHLQQQSWAAVVANLEDIVASFEEKANKLECLYLEILKNKSTYQSLLEKYVF